MANWSRLQHDMLELIAQRLTKIEDYVAFGAVCTSWRAAAAASENNFKGLKLWQQIPCLMLSSEDDDREFYSLMEQDVVAKVSLPNLKGKKCYESLGWLLTVGQQGEMSLVHPFSAHDEIPLPHQNTFKHHDWLNTFREIFVEKFVLSANPCETSDFVVMLICGSVRYLAFWRNNDQNWTKIKTRNSVYGDVKYHDGKFYAIDHKGYFVVCDISGPNPTKATLITRLIPYSEDSSVQGLIYSDELHDFYRNLIVLNKHLYIVESSHSNKDSLRVVTRDCFANYDDGQDGELDQPTYDTKGFQVYEVDLLGGTWKEINCLGNRALFLGHSASISLDVSTNKLSPKIKQNHIYFTDDCWQGYLVPNESDIPEGGGGKDMGVCNLETGIIEPFYNVPQRISLCPSIWITPNF
ncbi:hypothetical protein ACH5RR_041587 [Cinchona calisaya]|uniref:KIB1-4 beta-propeller domain-containing protein n=1 Tax=Cinchona calisaya TaxID=153742 RepID=A0ABD2XXZ3_9GENT